MRIILVSNFDISCIDNKIIEHFELLSFVKLHFPKYEFEDLKDIFDHKLKVDGLELDDIYKLSKLDKIYNSSVKHIESNFHNLNDFLYFIPENAKLASHEYRNKERLFYSNIARRKDIFEKYINLLCPKSKY